MCPPANALRSMAAVLSLFWAGLLLPVTNEAGGGLQKVEVVTDSFAGV